jgi:hypothetical protein
MSNISLKSVRIYHITDARNLPSVLAEGGIHCDAIAASRGLSAVSVAHEHIKERRARKRVPTTSGGTLADYVPFYFAPRSPMLFAIHTGAVQGYDQGQEPIAHLVSTVDVVARGGLPFVFSDGHAVMSISRFFTDLTDLDQIDWQIMRATYWNDTNGDGDRTRRRQAEFLVHHFFPWTLVHEIGVMTERAATYVNRVLEPSSHRPAVTVRQDWYYRRRS